ncbi:MAG: flagellin [Planctomycetes bacterium]|nr:flagellin [Planctomycetota bacterium]
MSRINTNIPAMVAIERLRRNQGDLVIRLERLSTGLRINRGADDPAGLIASETLRKEIRGIRQAVNNSVRAINVIATAEGALGELSRLMLDLRSLITSTANTGAISDEETQANQQEIDSILASIDRIANTTVFAGKKLLSGELGYTVSSVATSALASVEMFAARFTTGGTRDVRVEVTQSAETAALFLTGSATAAATIELRGAVGSEILSFASGTSVATIVAAVNSRTEMTGVSATVSSTGLELNSTGFGSDALVSIKALAGNFIVPSAGVETRDVGVDAGVLVNGRVAHVRGLVVDARGAGLDARFILTTAFGQTIGSTTFTVTGGGSVYQITPEISLNGQVHVGVPSVSTGNLGNSVVGFLHTIGSGGVNAVSDGNFIAAENILTASIEQISTLRGRLGSIQKNQLETNINSQQIALENVSASESIIRDADMAVEVAALTRAQILVQSTQAILQIATSLPQSVLSLLQ